MRPSLALLALAVATMPATAQTTTPSPPAPRIVVQGEGRRSIPPDRVTITLAVQSRAKKAELASRDNATRMASVQNAVKALGVDKSALATLGYSLQYYQDFQQKRDSGYLAMNSLRVRLSTMDLAGKVIDAAIAAGANSVSSIDFSVADQSAAYREALADAVRNARAAAQAMAEAAGGSLGDLELLSTQASEEPRPVPQMAMARMASADAATMIEARDIEVYAFVTGTWRFVRR